MLVITVRKKILTIETGNKLRTPTDKTPYMEQRVKQVKVTLLYFRKVNYFPKIHFQHFFPFPFIVSLLFRNTFFAT